MVILKGILIFVSFCSMLYCMYRISNIYNSHENVIDENTWAKKEQISNNEDFAALDVFRKFFLFLVSGILFSFFLFA